MEDFLRVLCGNSFSQIFTSRDFLYLLKTAVSQQGKPIIGKIQVSANLNPEIEVKCWQLCLTSSFHCSSVGRGEDEIIMDSNKGAGQCCSDKEFAFGGAAKKLEVRQSPKGRSPNRRKLKKSSKAEKGSHRAPASDFWKSSCLALNRSSDHM